MKTAIFSCLAAGLLYDPLPPAGGGGASPPASPPTSSGGTPLSTAPGTPPGPIAAAGSTNPPVVPPGTPPAAAAPVVVPPAASAPVRTGRMETAAGVMKEATQELQEDQATMAAQLLQVNALNQTIAQLNTNAGTHDSSQYQDELDDLNEAAIALNAALGSPIQINPPPTNLPPTVTPQTAPKSGGPGLSS